jgi:glycosyltransferase involved in cell wall biosynthesis
VLHVIPAVADRYGGPSGAILEMTAALEGVGVSTLTASTDADGEGRLPVPLGEPVTWRGRPFVFFRKDGGERFKRSRSMAAWLDARVGEFDLVHIHAVFSHATLAAGRACLRAGVPFVIRPLGSLAAWSVARGGWYKRPYLRLVAGPVMEGAAAWHFTGLRERREAFLPVARERGVVIPHGVDAEGLERLAEGPAEGLPPSPYLVQCSRLDPKKRTGDLLASFGRLPGAGAWTLALAGTGDEALVRALRAAAAPLGERVRFLGWVEGGRKARLLRDAALSACVSSHENFGIAVAESMALGTPVVVARGVSLADEVEEAGAGWCVREDLADLDRVLEEALRDEEGRRARGERARRLVRERFEWAAVARNLRGLYEGVRAGKGPPGPDPGR